MAMACERCGYRTSEVKSGGAISPKGRRIELKLADAEDVTRDVLKVHSRIRTALHAAMTTHRALGRIIGRAFGLAVGQLLDHHSRVGPGARLGHPRQQVHDH